MQLRGASVVVESGDNLSSIARQLGTSWRDLYEAPENEELRRKRPDPNKIKPRDVIALPPEVARRAAMKWLAGSVAIVVNGRRCDVWAGDLMREHVLALAGFVPSNPNVTVTYQSDSSGYAGGLLRMDESVRVAPGMIFNAWVM
jgi:hypothetical protein